MKESETDGRQRTEDPESDKHFQWSQRQKKFMIKLKNKNRSQTVEKWES